MLPRVAVNLENGFVRLYLWHVLRIVHLVLMVRNNAQLEILILLKVKSFVVRIAYLSGFASVIPPMASISAL